MNKEEFTAMMRLLVSLMMIFGITLPLSAATLSVPDQYPTIQAASAAAQDNDTVLIEAGIYNDSSIITIWSQNNLTLKGSGGMAVLDATGIDIPNGKAIFVISGNNVVVEQIEFTGADVPDNNGAGIRYEGTGKLTVKNAYFHDNEMGILTGNLGTEEIVIDSCEFHDHGKSNNGFSHNIYIGRGAKFTMTGSYSHDAYIGHNVKSRADENYILYNRIFDLDEHSSDRASSYLIDLPEGGLSYVIGNELHQSAKAENTTAISYARENRNGPLQTLYFVNNTLVNDRNNGIALNMGGTPGGKIINNIFDNFRTIRSGTFTGEEHRNIENPTFIDRALYIYQLQRGSAGIDAGVDPGSGNGFALTPVFQYRHPLEKTARPRGGKLDIGAFERAGKGIHTLVPLLLD